MQKYGPWVQVTRRLNYFLSDVRATFTWVMPGHVPDVSTLQFMLIHSFAL